MSSPLIVPEWCMEVLGANGPAHVRWVMEGIKRDIKRGRISLADRNRVAVKYIEDDCSSFQLHGQLVDHSQYMRRLAAR